MTDIPKYSDAQLLPLGTVLRPSVERMPFDSSGALKPEGPGPLPDGFWLAPDLDKFPQWKRTRGNEWTTAPFRALVLGWLSGFVKSRAYAKSWEVIEIASSDRSNSRLSDDNVYLRIRIKTRNRWLEVAQQFPVISRTGVLLDGRLAIVALSLDAIA